MPTLRRLAPSLSRDLWIYTAGIAADSLGRGTTMPFVLIYLHEVRGFSLGLAGLIAASFAAAGLGGTFVGGVLSDKVGARRTLVGSLLLTGIAYGWLGFIEKPWQGFAAMALSGLGFGSFRTSHSTALATLAGENALAAFSVNRAATNLGLGLGAMLGGLIATTANPSTFTTIFLVDAGTSLLFAVVITLALRDDRIRRAAAEQTEEDSSAGYRDVFRQRRILAIVAMNLLFVCAGYAALETALPIFAKTEASISERGIGLLFLVNTFAVAVLQLPATRLLDGRRHFRTLALVGPIWAVAWVAVVGTGLWLAGGSALAVLVAVVVVFAVGECALPVQSKIVFDLAPAALRGRCLGLLVASYAVGLALGPALIGLALSVSPFLVWPVAIGVLLGAGAVALALDRSGPAELRVVRATTAAAPEPV